MKTIERVTLWHNGAREQRNLRQVIFILFGTVCCINSVFSFGTVQWVQFCPAKLFVKSGPGRWICLLWKI